MKRNAFAVGILCMVLIILSSCGAKSGNEANTQSAEIIEESIDDGQSSAEIIEELTDDGRSLSEEDSTPDSWRSLYMDIINDINDDKVYFNLIYLNDDDIPELVVIDNYYLTYSVYTVNNDELLCLVDSLYTVEMDYYEHKNVIRTFARANGGGDAGQYWWYHYKVDFANTIDDDSTPILYFHYSAIYDDGVFTGEGEIKYYYMGQEIDEKEYDEMLASLEISVSDGIYSQENQLRKDEIIDILSQ